MSREIEIEVINCDVCGEKNIVGYDFYGDCICFDCIEKVYPIEDEK